LAGVRHTFSVAIADDASAVAAGEVLPSHWNAEHTLSDVPSQTSLDVVSNALSNEISNRTSADNVLSNRISALSLNALANLSIVTPVDGNALMYNSATGEWHNSTPPAGAGGSVTSTEASAISAQAASALSQALSVLSVTDAALSARADSIANAVSIVSNAASNALSVANAASQAASVVSTAASNALSVANAASQAASVVSNALSNEISNRASAINALTLNALSQMSIVTPVDGNALMYNSATGEWHNSTPPAGAGGSVTSTELSAVSAQAASAISQLNSIVSQLNSAFSVATNRHQRHVYGNTGASVTISAATLTNLPSMSVSCAAGGVYEVNGWVAYEALTSGGFLFGVSLPALGQLGANFRAEMTSAIGGIHSAQFIAMSAVAAGQTAITSVSIPVLNSRRVTRFEGMIHASAAGTAHFMMRASVAASGLLIKGAFLHAYRID